MIRLGILVWAGGRPCGSWDESVNMFVGKGPTEQRT